VGALMLPWSVASAPPKLFAPFRIPAAGAGFAPFRAFSNSLIRFSNPGSSAKMAAMVTFLDEHVMKRSLTTIRKKWAKK
jgi:hypothetical protein